MVVTCGRDWRVDRSINYCRLSHLAITNCQYEYNGSLGAQQSDLLSLISISELLIASMTCINREVYRIFRVSDRSNLEFIRCCVGLNPMKDLIDRKRCKFNY